MNFYLIILVMTKDKAYVIRCLLWLHSQSLLGCTAAIAYTCVNQKCFVEYVHLIKQLK